MKYDNAQYEESIDLLGLIAKILRKRRWLVFVALIGALALGGYKGVIRPEKAGSESEIAELKKALDSNTEKLAKNEEEIAANEITIAENQEKIAADEELLATRQEARDTLEKTFSSLSTALEKAEENLANTSAASGQISEVIMQILTLKDDISDTHSSLNTAANRVKTTSDEIAALQADIEKLTASNEKLNAANEELRVEINDQKTRMEKLNGSAGMEQIIKYAMLGAVLGAFLVCGIVFLKYLQDKTLHNSEELKEKYDLPILGEFCSAAALKHSKFEKMLDRLSGDVQTLPEKRQVYDLIAAGIQASGGDLPMRLAVTGTVDKEILHEVSGWLCKFLPEEYEVLMASNPVYNPGFLAELRQYTILLVEVKQSSDKREIDKLAEVLYRNEVKVIGAVVL